MQINCGHCNGVLNIHDSDRGATLRCPRCGVCFVVTETDFLEVCPSCRAISTEDVSYCPKCGSSMTHGVKKRQKPPLWRTVISNTCAVASFLLGIFVIGCILKVLNIGTQFVSVFLPDEDGKPQIHERYVKLKCPYCKRESIYEWKNSEGEKVIHRTPGYDYCLYCKTYFEIPQKYK